MADKKPAKKSAKKSAKKATVKTKRVTYEEWMKKHPKTVFNHSAPREVSRIESPEVLKFFNEEMATRLDLEPLAAIGDPTLSWCYSSSLPGSGWYSCDSDSES